MTGARPLGDCYQALAVAEGMPYGLARTALVEEVVAEADTLGDRNLAVEARLDLCAAYSYGGEPLKRLPVFAWLLARHDEQPFDGAHLYRLLWQYKWMTTGVLEHPDIPLATILSTLEDMERRYADAGEGDAPVLGCRYEVAAHVHGPGDAVADYLAWTRAPRTRLSDCRACEPTVRVRHLAGIGRHDDAVAEALPVLSGEITCAEQPATMIAAALESLLRTGHGPRAATEHLRGVRQTRHHASGAAEWARYVHVLTRCGRLQRAGDLLTERLHEIDSPPTPEAGMLLAAAGAGLCARLADGGWGDHLVVPHRLGVTVAAPTPAADLVAPLRAAALAAAARFDQRNGTDTVGAGVRAWLDPQPLPDLPLDLLPDATRPQRSGRRAAEPGRTRHAIRPDVPLTDAPLADATTLVGLEPGSLEALAAALETARHAGDRRLRAHTLRQWRERRDALLGSEPALLSAPPWDPADSDRQRALDAARLDCATALDDLEDDPGLLYATRALGGRLHDAGDEAGAYRFELWWLREAVLAGLVGPDEAIRAADDVLSEARTGLPPGDQGTTHLALLALLDVIAGCSGAGHDLQARQTRALQDGLQAFAAVETITGLDGYQRGCYALLLRLNATQAPAEDQPALLEQALALLPPGVRQGERALIALDLAGLYADNGQDDAAFELLAGAEPDAQAAGDHQRAALAAAEAGRLLARHDDIPEAIAATQRAVRSAENGTDPLVLDQARRALVHVLHDAGRALEAAEIAELAFVDAERRLRSAGLEPGEPPTSEVDTPPRLDVHVTGTLGWIAAVCAEELGERLPAHRQALAAAGWHARNRSHLARAEALDVAARTADTTAESANLHAQAADAYDAGGRPWAAAVSRRDRAFPLAEAEGLAAALAAIDDAHHRADAIGAGPDDNPDDVRRRTAWEHVALDEQAARVTAQDGQLPQALAMTDTLDDRYRSLGALASVWDVTTLRARILYGLGMTPEACEILTTACDDAAATDPSRIPELAGLLADLLTDTGDDAAADDVRRRFGLT